MDSVSTDHSNSLYSLAYLAYEGGRYQDALHFFRVLTVEGCHLQKNWIGLAACYQMLGEYNEAIKAYGVAVMIDETNPEVHLHAAQCLFALGQKDEAQSALLSAEKLSAAPQYSYLESELAFIRKKWNNKPSSYFKGGK